MLIAEVGLAHDGSLGNALAFIDAVADAGADAVKFQCHLGDPNTDPPQSGCCLPQDRTRHDYWERTGFNYSQFALLREAADTRNLKFGVTPFSVYALQMVAPLCDFIKLGRRNLKLIAVAARTSKPIIATNYCVSDYGVRPKGLLLNRFVCPPWSGISDHSGTIWPCIRAAALGAEIFEVHVCWDRRQFGPDVPYSITIDELAQLAEGIKACR